MNHFEKIVGLVYDLIAAQRLPQSCLCGQKMCECLF